MKTRIKQLITTIPGIVLICTGVVFMILDVLKKVDFDTWHMISFFAFGLMFIFGSTSDFKAFFKAFTKRK